MPPIIMNGSPTYTGLRTESGGPPSSLPAPPTPPNQRGSFLLTLLPAGDSLWILFYFLSALPARCGPDSPHCTPSSSFLTLQLGLPGHPQSPRSTHGHHGHGVPPPGTQRGRVSEGPPWPAAASSSPSFGSRAGEERLEAEQREDTAQDARAVPLRAVAGLSCSSGHCASRVSGGQ